MDKTIRHTILGLPVAINATFNPLVINVNEDNSDIEIIMAHMLINIFLNDRNAPQLFLSFF